jgi:hypothetical protein
MPFSEAFANEESKFLSNESTFSSSGIKALDQLMAYHFVSLQQLPFKLFFMYIGLRIIDQFDQF